MSHEGPVCQHEVCDTTYVDDEAVMLAAATPAELDLRIASALVSLCRIFEIYGLNINWAKGKTEAILLYRGKGASQHWKARFRDGTPSIDTPVENVLNIVSAYKYVGSIVEASESLSAEAQARAASSLAAWYRIAARVFGSPLIPRAVKLRLAYSLIFSRLFYGVETWAPSSIAPLRVLEAVQTRVARRIAECWVRAGAQPTAASMDDEAASGDRSSRSNESVRRELGMISVQAGLRRRRLLFLPRLHIHAPDSLRALIQSTPRGQPLPWVQLLLEDLRAVKAFHAWKLHELPAPETDARAWVALASCHRGAWQQLVREATTEFRSALTCTRRHPVFAQPNCADDPAITGVVCYECPPEARRVFSSQRAMRAHQAAAHAQRRGARNFIDNDGVCPGCGHCYGTRARAIVHATKVLACADAIASRGVRLDPKHVEQLDVHDADCAKTGRRSGHPTPLVRTPGPARGPKRPLPGSLLG